MALIEENLFRGHLLFLTKAFFSYKHGKPEQTCCLPEVFYIHIVSLGIRKPDIF